MNPVKPIANPEAQEQARQQARTALLRYPSPTIEQIRQSCEKARRFTEEDTGEGTVDVEELIAYFVATSNIFVAPMQTLSDPKEHREWLAARRGEVRWKFWERYQTFLQMIEQLPEPVIRSVDARTEGILELLEDPRRSGQWDRRGLVVGSVQSGKTGNFLGLACKALDAGYKLVIILAGIHNSLRAQTQIRMEEGLLGYNTDSSLFFEQASKKVGVGTLAFPDLPVNSMTSRAEDGDFKAASLKAVVHIGETPFIVVVKKHGSILNNLRAWLTQKNGVDKPGGGKIVRDIPMLVIDDEADHSSINTKKPGQMSADGIPPAEVDPTKINQRIRELLDAFEKSAYVGYTATPFANIFVDPKATHSKFGDDLFPRSFIVSLPPPDNYVSVEKVFGRDGDPDAGLEERKALPLSREVEDFDDFFPPKAKSDFVPDDLPGTLKEAIRAFLLACTARHARGQTTKHNSMLVHVARFVEAQGKIAELVKTELLFLQRRIAHEGEGASLPLRKELRELWESDFIETTRAVNDPACPVMSWQDIEASLYPAISKIRVLEINGSSADVLDYEKHRATGISVIAVGGDKLSRGLTLEGLSVSYYMRVSKMYDSLLQMGRWFGYRPGYLDLCRIYTSPDLIAWYRHVALAEAELRREFERMTALRATPEEYGLRVRTHPDGMLVTALNKARASKKLQVSYEGTLAQCVVLATDDDVRKRNDGAVTELIARLGKAKRGKDGTATRVWTKVDAETVCMFLDAFNSPMGTNGFDARRIAQFVRRQQSHGELVEWTVALVSARGGTPDELGGLDVQLVKRKNVAEGSDGQKKYYVLPNSNVLNPPDQAIDLEDMTLDIGWVQHLLGKRAFGENNPDERAVLEQAVGRNAVDVAMEISKLRYEADKKDGRVRANQSPPTRPTGAVIRDIRQTSHGLLLLYPLDANAAELPSPKSILTCALSFPTSATAEPIEYQVNEVYRQLHLDQIEEPQADE
ncbi:Z1 domain-containing protein [Ralstonia wenshanensis]|uniref:Z1 domain-containing protein n=1 Tax=Ralstonia wenshanensis TaxID=2842456 RepID=UPI002AAE85C2|nr:Z1 domain-containing protein [Ralstonia wenshanensis]MDY7508152.1 Z1 domain-containing protein [Ralstonia wenshanensis]